MALFVLLFPMVSLNLEAEIWIGMQKGELFHELGAPSSSLAAGPKELHHFSDGRRVEILNDQVVSISGFSDEEVIVVTQKTEKETVKASTAYADSAAKTKRASEFIDFKVLENAPKETFTISNSKEKLIDRNRIEDFLKSNKATTLYVLGGGIVACLFIGILISYFRSRKAVPLEESPVGKADHELPPFLQSTPTEKPSLNDPRGDMSELREERLSQREDPDSLGLSIRATPYQDFDSSLPRGRLVSTVIAAGSNPAYASGSNAATATASSKPTRKTRGSAPKVSEPATKRKSSLKLESD